MAQTIRLKRSAVAGRIPTVNDLELGEVAINTVDGKMYIKKSVSGVESIVEVGGGETLADGVYRSFSYTATSGQTSFTGADDNSATLGYSENAVEVFMNGVMLDPAIDFTTNSSGTIITLVSAANAGDLVQIISYVGIIGTGDVVVDTFTGDNTTVAFTLTSDPGTENNVQVFVDGVYQEKDAYTVSGVTLTLSEAPATGSTIEALVGTRAVTIPDLTDLSVDTLTFRGGTGDQGTLSWNADEDTLDLIVGAATLQIGQEQYFRGKATEAIANGDVVMFAGAQGSHLLIAKADMGSVGFRPEYVIGIATQSLSTGEFGFVTTFGKVRNLDTSLIAEGTILYVDPNTAGGLTATRPSAPDHVIQMCAVVYSHAIQGTYLVRPMHFPDTDEVEEGTTNLYYTDSRVGTYLTTNSYATQSYVSTAISNLVDSAPTTLDTLNELAAALGDDANFSTTVTNSIATKVPLAGGTMTGNLAFGDSVKATFGASDDLQIYHDGSHSYIKDDGTGRLYIQAQDHITFTNSDGTETYANFASNGAVGLRYDNATKLATTSTGIDVTGTVTADGLEVNNGVNTNAFIKSTSDTGTTNLYFADASSDYVAGIKYDHSTNDLSFRTGGGDRVTIDSTGIDVTGTAAVDGDITIYRNGVQTRGIKWDRSGTVDGAIMMHDDEVLRYDNFFNLGHQFRIGASGAERPVLNMAQGGDISFFDTAGSTAKFYWDSSAESLGIGTSSPSYPLHINNTVPIIALQEGAGTSTISGDAGRLTYNSVTSKEHIFQSGGTERMRIDSTGKVGIGTASNLNDALVVGSSTDAVAMGSSGAVTTLRLGAHDAVTGANARFDYDRSTGKLTYKEGTYDSEGSVLVAIDNNGYVGIGTSSPSYALHVGNGTADKRSVFNPNNAYAIGVSNGSSFAGWIGGSGAADTMVFSSSGGTERMRLASDGTLRINTTAGEGPGQVCILSSTGSRPPLALRHSLGSEQSFQYFINSSNSAIIGSIVNTGNTGVTYNTTSDRRLKDNIQNITNGTEKLMSMRPVIHTWKADPEAPAVHGFIAQEMQQVVPEAVMGEPDGEKMMSMDYGRITPVLVAALQDAHKKIEELEARLQKLEDK